MKERKLISDFNCAVDRRKMSLKLVDVMSCDEAEWDFSSASSVAILCLTQKEKQHI